MAGSIVEKPDNRSRASWLFSRSVGDDRVDAQSDVGTDTADLAYDRSVFEILITRRKL